MTLPILNRLRANWVAVLIVAGLVLSLSMGVRQTFGLVMVPMLEHLSIGRETFGIAMAIQNLLWGLVQPIAGMVADRFGSARVLVAGTFCYVAGLWVMATAGSAWDLNLGGGVLIGAAMSGTAFAVVLGAVGRVAPANKRSMALGLTAAGGSAGQFVMPLIAQPLITMVGWSDFLILMLFAAGLIAPLAVVLAGNAQGQRENAPDATAPDGIRAAIGEAFVHKGYWLLTIGFFVCGFQVVFVAVHLPAYIVDLGLDPSLGATALGLIGFFNIIGTWGCGALGARFSKKGLLSLLYILRSAVIIIFLLAPKTETSILLLAVGLGFLWLGTIPLTSGLVAQIFGPRYMTTLFGIVFFSHQLGSFAGVWLAGWAFDTMGSYDIVWHAAIVFGLISAVLHLPINEISLRRAAAPQPAQ